MSFDWQQDSKELYFRKVEEKIEAAGLGEFLRIDRSQFGTVGQKTVKVYMQRVHREGNMRKWWEAKRTFPEFKECPAPRNAYGKKEKPIFLRGYFEIDMEVSEE